MASSSWRAKLLAVPLFLGALPSLVAGSQFDICSDINTSSMGKNVSIYQTNGLCQNFCAQNYAYAVTQDYFCWCTNFTPDTANQLPGSRCSTPCPAWPPEDCGGPGAFSYIVLNVVLPSGTLGPSSSSSSSSSTSSSTSPPSSSSGGASRGGSITTSDASGSVKTVFLSPTGSSDSDSGSGKAEHHGLSTGAIVGIVVGLIGAVLIVAGALLYFYFRRKRQEREEQDGYQSDPGLRAHPAGMMRSNSEMRMSNNSPPSPNSAGNRSSMLQIDPRMDPFKQGLYVRSASHESVNTLRDDHDYSRRILRATNPDPEAETS